MNRILLRLNKNENKIEEHRIVEFAINPNDTIEKNANMDNIEDILLRYANINRLLFVDISALEENMKTQIKKYGLPNLIPVESTKENGEIYIKLW